MRMPCLTAGSRITNICIDLSHKASPFHSFPFHASPSANVKRKICSRISGIPYFETPTVFKDKTSFTYRNYYYL